MKALSATALIGTSLIAGFATGFALRGLQKPTGPGGMAEPDAFFIAKEKEVWEALRRQPGSRVASFGVGATLNP